MLLLQQLVRVDTPSVPCLTGTVALQSPPRNRHQPQHASRCKATAASGWQPFQRCPVRAAAVAAESSLAILHDAERHAALPVGVPEAAQQAAHDVAPAWCIPPEEWAGHPTLLSGCEPDAAPLRVAVLLSGGVDSSVALRLAQAAGHRVTAFYLQIWFQDDFRNFWEACPWEEDLDYCRQVCEQAGVPLKVVPLTGAYWERVVAHSIAEIRAGRTPNPDIMCNSRVKFGAFLEHLESAHAGCFDRVASGHYAGVTRDPATGAATLRTTADAVKDQTYFLAHLSQAQLARVMFPLAPLTKGGVRALAAAARLPNRARRDSQGICFLGKVHHSEFVREHLGEWPGPLVDEDTGAVLGYHQGFWFHTIGQRKGVPLSGGPWYVVRKDITMNAVYISKSYHTNGHRRNGFRCGPFNWLTGEQPDAARLRRCKVRHGPESYACRVTFQAGDSSSNGSGSGGGSTSGSSSIRDGGSSSISRSSDQACDGGGGMAEGRHRQGPSAAAVVWLDGPDQGVAPGQYAVFYDGGTCLGSAVIQEALSLPDIEAQ